MTYPKQSNVLLNYVTCRIPTSTLVGVYDMLQKYGYETKNVAYSTAVVQLLRGLITHARQQNHIPSRREEDLVETLLQLSGKRAESTTSFGSLLDGDFDLPDRDDQEPGDPQMQEIERALDKVLHEGSKADLRVEQQPDETPVETDTCPWKDVPILPAEAIKHTEFAQTEKYNKDAIHRLAVRTTLASIPTDMWESHNTRTFIKAQENTFNHYIVTSATVHELKEVYTLLQENSNDGTQRTRTGQET